MYPNEENMFILSNHNKNEDYYENLNLPIWRINFDSEENGEKKSFSCQTKALELCIPMGKTCLWHPITKIIENFTKSKFVSFDRWTLIL